MVGLGEYVREDYIPYSMIDSIIKMVKKILLDMEEYHASALQACLHAGLVAKQPLWLGFGLIKIQGNIAK
jgi:hypothetical protein